MTPDEFMDFTRPLPDRPYDEQYDSQRDVERDPCGAWVAIQHMAHHLAAAPQPAPAPADERAAMIEVIVQADDAYDRVQGGSWAGAIADALLAAAWTRGGDAAGQLAALTAAINAERDALIKYDRTPSDRGGSAGPKGRAYSRWLNCRADVVAALARPSAPRQAEDEFRVCLHCGVQTRARFDPCWKCGLWHSKLAADGYKRSQDAMVQDILATPIEKIEADGQAIFTARPSAPETQQGLTREQVGHMLDAKRKAEALDELAALGQQCDKAAPETLAWAVVGKDGAIIPSMVHADEEGAWTYSYVHFGKSDRIVRVAIRVVEDGGD